MRTLEVMTQKEKEGFTEFLTRWRKESFKVDDKPKEYILFENFVANLRPAYAIHLKYQSFDSFNNMIAVGTRIKMIFVELNLRSQRAIKAPHPPNYRPPRHLIRLTR